MVEEESIPLCVDLDGTLIKTDLLYESAIKLVAEHPLHVLYMLRALLRGIPSLKSYMAEHVHLRIDLLPYREEVLEYIQEAKAEGRKVVLVTASSQVWADEVGEYLQVFDEIHGTSQDHNLKGKRKANFLKERYGKFEYVGDSSADLSVWKESEKISVVASCPAVKKNALALDKDARVFEDPFRFRTVLRMLRVHQWVKNLLIFVPLIMAHRFADLLLLTQATVAFVLFSMTASSVYLLNDLVDLDHDRVHPTKKRRPLASGALSPQIALSTAALLLLVVSLVVLTMPWAFGGTLLTYFLLTTAYSFFLKRIEIMDIITLASLYTIRIIAGGAATGISVSEWLIAFSLFMFFSLACVKRFSELLSVQERNLTHAAGRGYRAGDIEQIAMFGSVSGYLSVLVLALYINSPAVIGLYAMPRVLWLLCPTLLYWITRVWLLARRGEMHEDPIVFAIRDKVSYLVFVVSVSIILFAL